MKRQTSTLAVKPAFTHMEDFTGLQVTFRWRKPHRVRKGRCLRVCAEDNAVWKGHVWRSSQHNCTWSIKMANIMLYSTCCQKKKKKKTALWLTFQQQCRLSARKWQIIFWGCFKQHLLSTLDLSPTESRPNNAEPWSFLSLLQWKKNNGISSANMQWQFEMFRWESKAKVKS